MRLPSAMLEPKSLAVLVAAAAVLALAGASSAARHPIFLLQHPLTLRGDATPIPYPTQDCSFALNLGTWTREPVMSRCTPATQQRFATCGPTAQRRWQFSAEAEGCGARRFDRAAAAALLHGRRLAFAGDSISRQVYAALLRLVGSRGQEVQYRHQDFNHTFAVEAPGSSGKGHATARTFAASFHWRPYPSNLTALVDEWGRGGGRRAPDAALLSSALWHLLHVSNASEFGRELQQLRPAVTALAGPVRRLVLASVVETFPNRMSAAAKRRFMRPVAVDAYNHQLVAANGTAGNGSAPLLAAGGLFLLLDMFSLTQSCGEECSLDGVHSTPEVYDAAFQVWLNLLAWQGQQAQGQQGQPAQPQGQQPQGRQAQGQQSQGPGG
eukprot:scaffold17.g467.t1